MNRPLDGKAALITGGARGLGLAITRAYIEAGASVYLCGRNLESLEGARLGFQEALAPKQVVDTGTADVSRPEDVRRVVAAAMESLGWLDILVNNAGVYGPTGPVEAVDWQAWVHTLEVNLLGSVLACREVLPHFRARGRGKIIQVSGGGATAPMPRISAYAASKAAVVRFVEGLAGEVQDSHIDVNAIAPGAMDTDMLDEVLRAGPEKVGQAFYDRMVEVKCRGGADPARAASLAVFLGSEASDGITGKLISAVWDPWEELARHREELAGSDVYTLRRILPKDRGWDWGDRGG